MGIPLELGEASDHWAGPRPSFYRRARAAILCRVLGHRWRIRLQLDGGTMVGRHGETVPTHSPIDRCARAPCQASRPYRPEC